MTREKGIVVLLLPFLAGCIRGDGFYNVINKEDPCISLCLEKTPLSFINGEYIKSCCERGCRFFNLVDLRYGLEPHSLNGTRDACEASCTEAYIIPQGRYACTAGCELMANQRVSDILTLFSMTGYDIPEIDILADPGLQKELLPLWWDSNGFKLPQTFIKTVPLDAGTVDYGIPSDYSGENEQSGSMSGSDWFLRSPKYTGVPLCLLTSVIIATAFYAFWLCLHAEKTNNDYKIFIRKLHMSTKVQLYMPDEAPLHKQPPPKYTDTINLVDDDNVKV